MFKKILVANRGEIAVRIMRTCAEMGIAAAAVYSDADRDAPHVRLAGESYRIGPPPAEESYLDAGAIVDAAQRSGAQAVHPGYGFLAESPEFAEACAAAGLTFVGPSPEALRLLGDKAAAKRLAQSVGVPLVPGYYGESQDDAVLLRKGKEVGFPVMIKAVKGGGGIGMRLVRGPAAFPEALEASRREAAASFGDGALILERFLDRPRHVEIQVMGDRHGNLLDLGDRECSIQRRYQKVIEEAPAPALGEELRRRMGAAAVSLARAAGYSNAGTVEFLLDDEGAFFFLEVNTRLQVEHPVTEWRLGLDLVRLQLMAAAGEPLPLGQEAVSPRGHSIEARICAEDPEQDYSPSAGKLHRFRPPDGPWIRNDVGVREGTDVPVFYDSLLGKLAVFGSDRGQAVERLRQALDEYEVLGVQTNLPMLRAIAGDEDFVAGRTDIDFVRRRIEPLLRRRAGPPAEAIVMAAAGQIAAAGLVHGAHTAHDAQARDPWLTIGPWRLGRNGMRFRYEFGGEDLDVVASHLPGTRRWEVRVGGERFDVELVRDADGSMEAVLDGERHALEAVFSDDLVRVLWAGREYVLTRPGSALVVRTAEDRGALDAAAVLKAPMPGRVTQVRVARDEAVSTHQTLLVLEAMKMEHLISAPRDGVVRRILCEEGQQVAKDDLLLEFGRTGEDPSAGAA